MGALRNLTIHDERRTDGSVRLSLSGELGTATTAALEDRLTGLRARRSPVSLDLSNLDSLDRTGLHMLIRMVGDARIKHWPLRIEPTVAPQVLSVFRLAHLDRFLEGGRPPSS
jgi:anti-anti-sigma factor